MKNRIKLALIASVVILIAACKATDPENLTFVDDKEIYNNIAKIRAVLNNVYSGLPDGYNNIGTSWIASASDESEEVNNTETIQNFNIGNITPYTNPDNIWAASYKSIRDANVFIKSVDTITWNELKYSNPTEYNSRVALTKQYKAEAKFLSAYFYFELIKRYGGVPLVDEVIDANSDWIARFPRRPFADCIDFIIAKCDEAALDLPTTYDVGNYGRATAGAAKALKARTLLYAASDLYNQASNTDPLLGYIGGDRTARWVKAAEANKAIISFTPAYTFNAAYQSNFLLGATKGTEVIFERRYGQTNAFDQQNSPIGFPLGQTGTCPSGNLADAYEHLDDGDFNWNNPVHAANPYNRRDPRLLKSVVTNASTFGKTAAIVELFVGGINGKPRDRASKTGYYLRKHMNETLDLQLGQTANRQWIFMRLAEFYLNYAEAMNEAYGPEGLGTGTLNVSARSALNSVRTRAAVGLKAIAAGSNQTQLKNAIRRERRVELAFEGHRFWDIKRWMIGPETLGVPLRGVNIVKNTNNTFTYTPFDVESRIWDNKFYFYPIPQVEITKSQGVLVQNKGW